MNVSILDPKPITENKAGQPVYISNVAEFADCYDLGLIACHNHIAFGIYLPAYRHGDNWQYADFAGFDFDSGQSAQVIHEQLRSENINHVIVSSKNHLRDKEDGRGIIERFHVLIPFNARVKDSCLYSFITMYLSRTLKWNVDKGVTKNACAYYFQSREVLYVYDEGARLDVSQFANLKVKQDELVAKEKARIQLMSEKLLKLSGKSKRSPMEVFKRTKYFRMLEQGDCNSDGSRYGNSNSIIGGMIRCGLNVSEAIALFDKYANYGTGFTRDSVEHRFNKWR